MLERQAADARRFSSSLDCERRKRRRRQSRANLFGHLANEQLRERERARARHRARGRRTSATSAPHGLQAARTAKSKRQRVLARFCGAQRSRAFFFRRVSSIYAAFFALKVSAMSRCTKKARAGEEEAADGVNNNAFICLE